MRIKNKRRRGNAPVIFLIMMASIAIMSASVKDIGDYMNRQRKEYTDRLVEEIRLYVNQLKLHGDAAVGGGTRVTPVYDLLNGAGLGGVPPQPELAKIADVTRNLVSVHSDYAYLKLVFVSKREVFPSVMKDAVNKLKYFDSSVMVLWDKSRPKVLEIKIGFRRGQRRG